MASRKRKVVSLFGALPACGEPDADVIQAIAELHRAAKAGAISGFAFVAVRVSDIIETNWSGKADGHRMLAGVSILQDKMLRAHQDG